MTTLDFHAKMRVAIDLYATTYRQLEELQPKKNETLTTAHGIPRGDQKTGCIGEYWAMRYARVRWPEAKICFGNHSQAVWDIEVCRTTADSPLRIQVKTVSVFGEGKMSKISRPPSGAVELQGNRSWHYLWVIHLDNELQPIGFWEIPPKSIDWTIDPKSEGGRRRCTRQLLQRKVPSEIGTGRHWITDRKLRENQIAEFRSEIGLSPLAERPSEN